MVDVLLELRSRSCMKNSGPVINVLHVRECPYNYGACFHFTMLSLTEVLWSCQRKLAFHILAFFFSLSFISVGVYKSSGPIDNQ
jgi:hypothetical protein